MKHPVAKRRDEVTVTCTLYNRDNLRIRILERLMGIAAQHTVYIVNDAPADSTLGTSECREPVTAKRKSTAACFLFSWRVK